MKPLDHTGCIPFDEAVKQKVLLKTDQGFYIKYIEWSEVPPEMVDNLKAQLEQVRAQQGLAPDAELKPFAIIGKCPFCEAALVDAPPGTIPEAPPGP